MNNFIKQVIEETFKSKKQQRLFFAKSQDKSLSSKERKKWKSMADEFSSKTDFEELPEKKKTKKKEVDEIVDDKGNIGRGKKPSNFNTKGITSNSTSDEVVRTAHGKMGTYGTTGIQNYRRYWGESDLTKTLGFDKTMGQDASYEDAENHFEDDLGLEDNEAEEKMSQMGYDKKLPKDKVRLVENPKKFVEEYIESIIYTKSNLNDIVQKEEDENEEKEINPIILKQINSLKNSMNSHKLSINDILKHLKK
jgi:hypothetical protein